MSRIEIVNKDELEMHPIIKHLGASPINLMEAILNHIQDCSIGIKNFICDHLCWRCATIEEYHKIKSLFSSDKDNGELGYILVEIFNSIPWEKGV